MRDEVQDVGVALDVHVLAHGDRARPRNAPEVVPPEVDEHHVLGALLRIALQLLGEELVLGRRGAAGASAGNRVGRELVAIDLDEELRARANHLERGHANEEQVRAGVDAAQAPVQADPIERLPRRRVERQVERLPPGQHDLDRLAGGDRVLGDLDRVDVLLSPQAGIGDGSRPPARPLGGAVRAPGGVAVQLRRRRSRRPIERLEHRLLGDPVAALEIRRIGVQRGDRRQGVGQVIEDEDEVGFDERGGRRADGIGVRHGHRRLEDRHCVVGERTHGAAGEAGHALGRLDPPSTDEGAERRERVGPVAGLDRQLRVVSINRHRPFLDARPPGADLEQPARTHAEERVPPESLAALHGFEEVRRRRAVVEPEEGADRRLEVGRAGRAQEQRVRVRGEPLRLGQAERIGACHVRRLRCCSVDVVLRIETTSRPGTKGRAFRGATLIRRCRTFLTDGWSVDRRSALPANAGALRRSLLSELPFGPEAPGSIHRRRRPGFHQPPGLSADARRVLVPFAADIRDVGRESRHAPAQRQGTVARPQTYRFSA